MTSSKLKTLVNYAFVVAIGYILIWYVFNPITDRCLMSFMMEPPRFIDLAVDFKPEISSIHTQNPYKLYLYREFNFPARNEKGYYLKDSFPVLFIPGNAGSFRQVRSLASTCIRKHIESLDAYKFVFYTVDFGGQLSGLNGDLVEDQTSYVKLCLDKIKMMQSDDGFNGVIIVGHSVGGFIAKSLFTLPEFDAKLVPLVISLSSPLVKPYVAFDYKMRRLYNLTNDYWQRYGFDESRTTTAISISGGRSDQLVPTQLTMDPHFDLSLTTTSTKDVWFSTDHNGITWCREIMYKLANTLSTVMDKQKNMLVVKPKLLETMKSQLLTRIDPPTFLPQIITREFKISKPTNIINFNGFHQILRSQFSEFVHLIDINKNQSSDLMIVIDHNHMIKPNAIFGCRDIQQTMTVQTTCLVKTKLIDYATPIPSSIYEPRRTIIKLSRENSLNQLNYLALDFTTSEKTLPESVIILAVDLKASEPLYLPSVIEHSIRTIFGYSKTMKNIQFPFNSILLYNRFVIKNQKFRTQYYAIKFEAHSCRHNEQASGGSITKSQNGYLIEGYTPNLRSGNKLRISVDIGPESNMIVNNEPGIGGDMHETVLDSYLDGACQHRISLEIDFFGMIANYIRNQLEFILTCTTYIAAVKIMASHFKMINKSNSPVFMTACGLFIIQQNLTNLYQTEPKSEIIIEMILLYGIAYGFTILLGFIVDRLIDIAIIMNRIQSYWIKAPKKAEKQDSGESSAALGNQHSGLTWNYLNITLFVVVIAMTVILSAALSSFVGMLLLIKLGLFIDTQRKQHRYSAINTLRIEEAHSLLINLGSLAGLAMTTNIPSGLIRIKSGEEMLLTFDMNQDNLFNLTGGLMSLLFIRLACLNIESHLAKTKQHQPTEASLFGKFKWMLINKMPSTSFHLLIILITLAVNTNLCRINYVLLAILIIINCVQ